jgi:DNA-binding transcriptional LysR family regulator
VERKPLAIDFRHLETFCRVADLKSFSKAAEGLFISQPAVTKHIKDLELKVGMA